MRYYDNRKLEFPCQFGQSIFNYSMASVTTDYRFSSNVGIDSFFGLFSTVHFPMCTQVVCIRRRIITLVTTDYKFSSNAGIDALPKSTQNNYRPSSVVFLLLSVLDQKEIKINYQPSFDVFRCDSLRLETAITSPSSRCFSSSVRGYSNIFVSFLSRFYGCAQTYDQASGICNQNGGRLFLPRSDDENLKVEKDINEKVFSSIRLEKGFTINR